MTPTPPWRRGLRAAVDGRVMLVPTTLSEFLSVGLELLLSVWLMANLSPSRGGEVERLLVLFARLSSPEFWTLAAVGWLLVGAGGWLLRTAVQSGLIDPLGALLRGAPPGERPAFEPSVVQGFVPFAATRIVGALCVAAAAAAAVGMVVSGLVLMVRSPGVVSALALAFGSTALLLVPLLEAAVLVGSCEAVLTASRPFDALASGLRVAWERPVSLLMPWYLVAVARLGLQGAAATAFVSLDALSATPALALLSWAPRLLVVGAASVAAACLVLWRLGLCCALLVEPPPSAQDSREGVPPPANPASAGASGEVELMAHEVVYEAVPVVPEPSGDSEG
jgi:hypothetical protein